MLTLVREDRDQLRQKEALVDAWGGWKHRRWEVLREQDDTRQLALMAKDLGLLQSRRSFYNLIEATAAKPDRSIHGRFGLGQHPVVHALYEHGLRDHTREFSVLGRHGKKPGAVLLQPYMGAAVDDGVAVSESFGARREQPLTSLLAEWCLDIRVVAHTPYNEWTIGVLLFSADDQVLLEQLEASMGYLAPVAGAPR